MIALLRIGHTPSGKKSTSDERELLSVFFQHSMVDVQDRCGIRIDIEGRIDGADLIFIRNDKAFLSFRFPIRTFVKPHIKGLPKQAGKRLREGIRCRDDPYFIRRKSIAI